MKQNFAMLKLVVCAVIFLQITSAFKLQIGKRKVKDNDDYLLICKHEPIDLGIVLDSSSSISNPDFQEGLKFLQGFLKEFSIGDGRNDVRVSLITFGVGVYPENGFDLDTYHNYDEVEKAIGEIKHEQGPYTDTGAGIKYMHVKQMSKARDYAEKVGLVITDGNSQEWRKTKKTAEIARKSGIKLFAVGIGDARYEELERIAGDDSRIIQVSNYSELHTITKKLANETCIRKPKPSTTPPPPTECGVEFPADINFIFSPADLGLDGTYWATDFISRIVENEDMQKGFRFGAVTGSCPEDEGFRLDEYVPPETIRERLYAYERHRISGLVERTLEYGFSVESGGREGADKIAVIIIGDESPNLIQEQIDKLEAQGIAVVIADPYQTGYEFTGAVKLPGPGAREGATNFLELLCGSL